LAKAIARWPVLVTALLALAGISEQAVAGSMTGHAAVAIGQFIAIVENKSMNFGFIAPPAAGGNVVLSTSGTITGPGGFVFVGAHNAGSFTASSFAGFPAVVTFGGNTTLSDTSGHTMALGNFTNDAAGNFDGAGSLVFDVGATLTVGANQAAGSYSGTYVVTVNW
jgi:Mat/Ecp fimbriae major subunit